MTAFNFEATASPPASSAGVTIFDPLERRAKRWRLLWFGLQVHCCGYAIVLVLITNDIDTSLYLCLYAIVTDLVSNFAGAVVDLSNVLVRVRNPVELLREGSGPSTSTRGLERELPQMINLRMVPQKVASRCNSVLVGIPVFWYRHIWSVTYGSVLEAR